MDLYKSDAHEDQDKPFATSGKVWSPTGEVGTFPKQTTIANASSSQSYRGSYGSDLGFLKALFFLPLALMMAIFMIQVGIPAITNLYSPDRINTSVASACSISTKDASQFVDQNNESFIKKTANVTYKKKNVTVVSKANDTTLTLTNKATGKKICSYNDDPLSLFGL